MDLTKLVSLIIVITVAFTILPIAVGEFAMESPVEENPWIPPEHAIAVSTLEDLDNIRNDLSGTYYLTNDINASETTTWNDGMGWVPIGDDSVQFTGELYGNNHTITGLYSAGGNADGRGGLFGQTSGSAIYDVRLIDYDITGTSDTGGLVGSNRDSATITNCYANGSATGSRTGGLVGINWDSAITNCYATGSASGSNTGGLVGYNYASSTITNSYATGSATGSSYTGGLVGYNRLSTITDSYATGDASGNRVGGLVGYNHNAEITNCYATGSVTGSDMGGLVGMENNGIVDSSFWDIETSGITTSDGGTGKTTTEMMESATFTDWDFVEVWGINEGISYPFILDLHTGNGYSEDMSLIYLIPLIAIIGVAMLLIRSSRGEM